MSQEFDKEKCKKMINKSELFFQKIKTGIRTYYEPLLALLGAVLIFMIGFYRVTDVYQPILYSDEYGYWAGSSFLLGVDWSSVTSRIPYYSYGYGVFLVIIRLLGRWFHWSWSSLYQAALVMHLLMLSASYWIALKLCKRYFPDIWVGVRYVLCLAVMLYTSNLVYSHVTLAESALTFVFWIFLWVLMRAVDKPAVGNHIALACVSFYLYVIHQRTLAVLITAVLLVVYMDLRKRNRWLHTVSFFTAFYFSYMIHTVIKRKLQNDFYLGNPQAGLSELFSYACNKTTGLLLLLLVLFLGLLFLCRKGKGKWALGLTVLGGLAVIFYIVRKGSIGMPVQETNNNIAANDFAGQIGKIKGIFTWKGFLRLCISMVGKWFYLASASALIICWGIKDLILHAVRMTADGARYFYNRLRGKTYEAGKVMAEKMADDLWILGVFLTLAGTFMICAIYKEGLYKVDDLVHGRYVEFLIGIVLMYSFNSLLKDKRWILHGIIFYVLYSLAGILCQYTLNDLGRTSFELSHSVILGRIFWNWEVPVGKVKILAGYVLPLALAFLLLVKVKIWPKLNSVRFNHVKLMTALLIPIFVWTMLSYSIIDHYVVGRNEKLTSNVPKVAFWIDSLDGSIPVYYLEDTENFRWAEALQFMLRDRSVIMTDTETVSYDEDAFFVMDKEYAKTPAIQEKCQTVVETSQFALLIKRGSHAADLLELIQGE